MRRFTTAGAPQVRGKMARQAPRLLKMENLEARRVLSGERIVRRRLMARQQVPDRPKTRASLSITAIAGAANVMTFRGGEAN